MTFTKVESWKNPCPLIKNKSVLAETPIPSPRTATVWETCLENEVDYGYTNFIEKELNRGGTEFPLSEFPGQVSGLAAVSSGARFYAHQPLPKASSHCTASC